MNNIIRLAVHRSSIGFSSIFSAHFNWILDSIMEISGDSDIEEEQNVTPTKKRKLHYEQKYSHLWEKDIDYSGWIKKSNKGDYYCYCNLCKCDLKCGGGKRVLTKHAESIKHKNNFKGW